MVDWWYYNNLFGVEDGLFYENNKRLGYYQDEKEDEILRNNHKATVDRMLELKELNIEFKRIHNKLKTENKALERKNEELKQMVDFYKDFQKDARELSKENEQLNNENKRLKAQLSVNSEEGVCSICKYCYLDKDQDMQGYYIAKCEKGHKECSKEALRYCEDFRGNKE